MGVNFECSIEKDVEHVRRATNEEAKKEIESLSPDMEIAAGKIVFEKIR